MDLLCLLGWLLAERENTGSYAQRDFKGWVVLSKANQTARQLNAKKTSSSSSGVAMVLQLCNVKMVYIQAIYIELVHGDG